MSARNRLAIVAIGLGLVLTACGTAGEAGTHSPLPAPTAVPTGTWPADTSPWPSVPRPEGEPTALSRQTERPANVPDVAEADQLEFLLVEAAKAGMVCEQRNVGGLHYCRGQLDAAEQAISYMTVDSRDGAIVAIDASGISQYADDDADRTGVLYYSAVQQLVDTIDAVKWSLFGDDVAIINDLAGENFEAGDWGEYQGSFGAGWGSFDFKAVRSDFEPWVPHNTFPHTTMVTREMLDEIFPDQCDNGACTLASGTELFASARGADVRSIDIKLAPDVDAAAEYQAIIPQFATLLPPGQADQVLAWTRTDMAKPLELAGLLASRTPSGLSISCELFLPSNYPLWMLPGVQEAADQFAATLADTSGGQYAWLGRLSGLTTPAGLETLAATESFEAHAGEHSTEFSDPTRRAGSMSETYVNAGELRYDVAFVRVNGTWLADMVYPV